MADPGNLTEHDPKSFWLTRWTSRRSVLYGLTFLFSLPLLSGVLGRLFKGRPVYTGLEFETLLCAGQKAAEGDSMYPAPDAFACDGLSTTASYVYIPWPSEALHSLRGLIGLESLTTLYAVLYMGLLVAAIWIAFFARFEFASRIERIPFLGLLTGSVVVWGNIAGLVYGLLALTARITPRFPLAMFSLIVLIGSLKQVWLCLLLVFLVLPWAAWRRWVWFLGGALLGLAPTVLFVASGSSEVEAWLDVLSYFAFEDRPGQGYLGWINTIGVPTEGLMTSLGWLIFAGFMVLATLGLCERQQLTAEQRVWVALAVASLLNPRLQAYEFFLLAPGMAIICRLAAQQGQAWARTLVYAACFVTVLMNVGDLGDYAIMPTTLACSIAVLANGLPAWRYGLGALLPPLRTASV